MKNIGYIAILFFLFSCAEVRDGETVAIKEATESVENLNMDDISEDFEYANISEQKLQEYFDLLLLQKKHPEFTETIAPQLNKISEEKLFIPKNLDSVDVKDLKKLGNTQVINDSVSRIQLKYTLSSRNIVRTDTINVYITRRNVTIDGKTIQTNKVNLLKNQTD